MLSAKSSTTPPIIMFLLIAALLFPTPAFAEEYSNDFVPPQNEVEEMKKRIDAKPIVPPKADISHNEANPASDITGRYPTYKGTILVTADAYKNLIPTGHAGIILRYDTVIESLAQGVTWGPNDWNESKQTAYGANVTKTTSTQDQLAANWCFNQEGKPYNFNYLDTGTRERFYCSQLVWAAFMDLYGIDISTSAWGPAIYPMEILDSPNVQLIYAKK